MAAGSLQVRIEEVSHRLARWILVGVSRIPIHLLGHRSICLDNGGKEKVVMPVRDFPDRDAFKSGEKKPTGHFQFHDSRHLHPETCSHVAS
jgi:hypothetical protein